MEQGFSQGPNDGHKERVRELFDCMFGQYLKDQGYIALAWKDSKTRRFGQVFVQETGLAASIAVDKHLQGKESYFAVNLCSRRSRKTPSIKALTCIHVDADFKRPGGLERLKQLEPSIIVSSGSPHSYHAYFLLEHYVGAEQRVRVERLNKAFAKVLGVDGNGWEVAKILRVPGTANYKDPKSPRPVEIIHWHLHRKYKPEAVAEILGVEAHESQRRKKLVTPVQPLVVDRGEALDGRDRYLNAEARLYITKLLQEGLFEPHSRNKAQLLLTMHFYELGYSQERICEELKIFFREHHNGCSRDWNENPDWVIHNIEYGVANWFNKASSFTYRASSGEPKRLGRTDRRFINSQPLKERDKQFLVEAMEWILNHKRGDTLIMSVRTMCQFATCNLVNYQKKRAMLYDLGIIALELEHDRNWRLANQYKVLYQFDESQVGKRRRALRSVADRLDRMILAGRTNMEIREAMPTLSRQRIQARRKRFDYQAHQSMEESCDQGEYQSHDQA